MMTGEQYRALLARNHLRQADAAWICGVGERQARAWAALGDKPIPQAAALLLTAYDELKITARWLVEKIGTAPD